MSPEEHYTYVLERFIKDEWNEWEAFAELLIVATRMLENSTQKCDPLAHVQYAAKAMGMWMKEKRKALVTLAIERAGLG